LLHLGLSDPGRLSLEIRLGLCDLNIHLRLDALLCPSLFASHGLGLATKPRIIEKPRRGLLACRGPCLSLRTPGPDVGDSTVDAQDTADNTAGSV
jgi:hypothetical protein